MRKVVAAQTRAEGNWVPVPRLEEQRDGVGAMLSMCDPRDHSSQSHQVGPGESLPGCSLPPLALSAFPSCPSSHQLRLFSKDE